MLFAFGQDVFEKWKSGRYLPIFILIITQVNNNSSNTVHYSPNCERKITMFKLVDLHSFITEIIIEGENSTFTDTLEVLADKYYWSRSVSNFSGKLSREI